MNNPPFLDPSGITWVYECLSEEAPYHELMHPGIYMLRLCLWYYYFSLHIPRVFLSMFWVSALYYSIILKLSNSNWAPYNCVWLSEVGKGGWTQMETQKGDTEGDTNGRVTKGGILYRSESRAVLIYMRRLCLHSPMSHAVWGSAHSLA